MGAFCFAKTEQKLAKEIKWNFIERLEWNKNTYNKKAKAQSHSYYFDISVFYRWTNYHIYTDDNPYRNIDCSNF
jgi:hypothetical protein